MDAAQLPLLPPDPSLPAVYWRQLTTSDQVEFLKLRTRLHQSQKSSVKDRRLVTFSHEMEAVLSFLDSRREGRDQKCVLAGIAFAGPFICVNTRQLKSFLGRCKSSINGSFQQLGYVAVRTKSKAKACVLSVLPILANDQNLLRQWTVRGASKDALFCFVPRFPPSPMPSITPEDLNEDKKISQLNYQHQIRKNVEFELSMIIERKNNEKSMELSTSYSMDYLSTIIGDQSSLYQPPTEMEIESPFGVESFKGFDDGLESFVDLTMPRSQSLIVEQKDWNTLNDFPLSFEI